MLDSSVRRFIRYVSTNCRGQANAQHGAQIADALGLPSSREVRDCMDEANEAGELIGAVPAKGYWYITSEADGEHSVKYGYDLGHKLLRNARNTEKAILKAYGPRGLF